MAMSKLFKAGAAFAATGAFALGAAGAAQAATYDVTSGHVDIASINSSNVIGSIFDDLSPSWAPYSNGHSYKLTFNKATTPQITCSNGVYTVPNTAAIEPNSPFVGFSNYGSSTYDIRMTRASGPGHVTFSTSSGVKLNTAPTPLTWGLAQNSHVHGSWKFDTNTGSCVSGKTYTFNLNFKVQEQATGSPVDSRAFNFIVKS